jgi:RNA polymerase sigma-70 factor (ECF subfamily)
VDCSDVRATLDGDGAAYERLVRRYQVPIAAYMWRFTRDLRERDELVQDVFVEAYLSLKTYAGRAPLLHWLKRVATRVGYRFWKSRRRRRELPLPDEADLMLATSDNAESAQHAAELVHYLLARLGHRDRLVMTLTYLEGCTVRETSELTGWSESMVKVQSHRARRSLAKICREMGVEL